MISKNLIKLIRSLELKKYRIKEGLFVAENKKVVRDLMDKFTPQKIIATEKWYEENGIAHDLVVTDDELRKISFQQHPQQVMALFRLPQNDIKSFNAEKELVIALDGVQDPGNLGTIIRIADWFGIKSVVCSEDTADAYNPKVVQSTMGSLARVHIIYTDLGLFLAEQSERVNIYGTFLNGQNIYSRELANNGIIIMGNEGKGISPAIARHVKTRLLIPNYPEGRQTADSLNVAIATAITCAEFRRRG